MLRNTPFRLNYACESLRGKVDAAHFVKGMAGMVGLPVVDILKNPEAGAGVETQALYGESLTYYDIDKAYYIVQLARDHYVGFIQKEAVVAQINPTHKVVLQGASLHAAPSVKSPTLSLLPFGARLAVIAEQEGYAQLQTGAYIYAAALKPIAYHSEDYISIAEQFLGTPYLWGGRSSFGIDCSGLLQTAMQSCGMDAPRDSDQQRMLGEDAKAPFMRGDLVFWKGHVGMMMDSNRLIHANAYTMDVTIEPLSVARDRIILRGGGDIVAHRRPHQPLQRHKFP